jgi:hypothetical protein
VDLKSERFKIVLSGLIALTVAAILVGGAPYLHDFAEWLYQAQIVRHLSLGSDAASGFTLATYPVPNSLTTILLAMLSVVFPPIWAGKIFLVAMLLTWYPLIVKFTLRHVDSEYRDSATFVMYALIALTTFFWYGFVSYQLGLMFLVLFFTIYQEDTRASVIAFFGLLLFFSHGIVFLVFGLFLATRVVFGWNRAVVTGLLPAAVCSLWFLVGSHFAEVEPQPIDASWRGLSEALIYKAGYPAMLGPFRNFVLPDGASLLEQQPWVYWAGFAANFVVAAMLGMLLMVAAARVGCRELRVRRSANLLPKMYATTLMLLLTAYVFAPYRFFGLINAGGRLLIPALLMALMLGGKPTWRILRLALWPLVLFSLLSSGCYLYLMIQTNLVGFHPVASASPRITPSDSVFEFNERLYSKTRYLYFNYRIFAFSRRFEQIGRGEFDTLAFRTGLLIENRR